MTTTDQIPGLTAKSESGGKQFCQHSMQDWFIEDGQLKCSQCDKPIAREGIHHIDGDKTNNDLNNLEVFL